MTRDEILLLRRVARLFNVQTAHLDGLGRRVEPPAEAIFSVLRTLGASLDSMSDLAGAFRERRQLLWREVIDPVVVARGGTSPRIKLRLPSSLADSVPGYEIVLESGATLRGRCQEDAQTINDGAKPVARNIEGCSYVTRRLTIPEIPPHGYHRLHLSICGLRLENYLFVAPLRAYSRPGAPANAWGIFCPLYALASAQSWGTGNFADLDSLLHFAAASGAAAVSTLPLLSAFLDEPFDPSPYAPVSRFFWNELFLDVNRIPELHNCPAAKSALESSALQLELRELRGLRYVDYRRAMSLKRAVLQAMLHCLLDEKSERRASFDKFVATHPLAQDYAAFRATTERTHKSWQFWQKASRDGVLRASDYDEEAKQYHLYAQWQCHEQMEALGAKTGADRPALYLDFPLGVSRDGYDVWREREAFALDASGGAPPDTFFVKGQNWGFPPLHPDGLQRQGLRYYIHCVRHHLRYARMLRIDHVMGLHRLYWVPAGFSPTEGVYVRYPAEAFYAVLNLESLRHKAEIIGENLGTVPLYVNDAMERHGLRGMHVSQFGIRTEPSDALDKPARRTVASLNTHDTATFAGFWSGADIDDRAELGLLTQPEKEEEHGHRAAQRHALVSYLRAGNRFDGDEITPEAVLRAWLGVLAQSEAEFLLVNLDDLWLEPLPQNVPGTWQERPNWKRKARFSLDEISGMPALINTLKMIDDIRKNVR